MPAFLLPLLTNPRLWAGLGLAAILALAGLQTARLAHAKADLAAARAALIDPATHQAWRAEALANAQALAQSRQSAAQLGAALAAQNAAVAGLRADQAQTAARVQSAGDLARRGQAAAALAAARLLAVQAQAGADPCAGADHLILQSLEPSQ